MYISGVKPSFTILCVRVGDNKLRELAGGIVAALWKERCSMNERLDNPAILRRGVPRITPSQLN